MVTSLRGSRHVKAGIGSNRRNRHDLFVACRNPVAVGR